MKIKFLLISLVLCLSGSALAQTNSSDSSKYPDKPVRLIITVPPGGASDFVARTLSESFAKELGTTVLVENKAGANGTIASAFVARAAADGYTLLQAGISTHGIGPYFYDKLTYDPFKDLIPVGALAEFPIILAVNAQLPVYSVKDLIELAKTKTLSFASAGTGSAPHLSGELFKTETNINMVHVPYKGSAPAVVDVASGQVDMMFDGIPSLLPHIKSGKLRPIAAVSIKRNSLLPDLPTFTELGYPSMVASVWYGLMAPVGTPKATIDYINTALNKALAVPELQKKLEDGGAIVMPGTPAEFGAFMQKDYARWGQVIKKAGISTSN
ncbi:MAG: tripartite tricarboxylate transporter substrate binding protein [Sheuella sp.]|nr:tripartite tricarboxylate transporter substrate binding protein [Sheuella sp.]